MVLFLFLLLPQGKHFIESEGRKIDAVFGAVGFHAGEVGFELLIGLAQGFFGIEAFHAGIIHKTE